MCVERGPPRSEVRRGIRLNIHPQPHFEAGATPPPPPGTDRGRQPPTGPSRRRRARHEGMGFRKMKPRSTLSAMSQVAAAEWIPLATDSQGVLRVGGTRVTLDTVVEVYQAGSTPEEIARHYPSLELA